MKTNKRYLTFGLGIGLCAATAFGTQSTLNGVLTIDGEVVSVAAESGLGENVSSVVLQNGGGVGFTGSLTAAKTYSIDGDGLNATGVVSVASGQQVIVNSASRLANGTLGHVLVKRGPGRLTLENGPGPVNVPTRWIVAEGVVGQAGVSFFGNHKLTTENLTLDIREGAKWSIDDGEHCPIGPLELTGGTLDMPGRKATDTWGNTAFRGGVIAHACATPSVIHIGGNAHLNHVFADVSFTVEAGAVLNVYGCLSCGLDESAQVRVPNRLIVSGGGELALLGKSSYTGGTVLRDGTTLTVGDSAALGTGGLEIDGDVTLNVPAGATFVCPAVTGAGTLTKVGAGTATFPTVAEGVSIVRAEGEGTSDALVENGVLRVHGGTATIDVPSGETLTLTAIEEVVAGSGIYTDLVKTGAGSLVLPTGNNAKKFRSLNVKGGLIVCVDSSSLGSGTTTLAGGGLRVTTTSNLARSVRVSGTGTIDVSEGQTLTVTSNYLYTANAVLTKKGKGTILFSGLFRDLGVANNARWVADEGRLTLGSNGVLANHATCPPVTLEVHEGATLQSDNHNPLGAVVLRGGTLTSPYFAALVDGSGQSVAVERMARWNPFSLNGTVTVLPSSNGQPSRISVPHAICVGHAANTTVFDVQSGATLEVEALLQPGENAGASAVQTCDLVKRGGGDLVLKRNCGVQGTVQVEGGSITLGPDARFAPEAKLRVQPGARIVLPDGSLLATDGDVADALLSSADVWLDASRLTAQNGATVSSVPNLGTARGNFAKFTKTANNFVLPGAPTYVADGINGLGALAFNGAQALVLQAYTNCTQNIEVFFVGEWTYWQNSGGKGKWGGPVSFGSFAMTADDNHSKPSFSFQHGSDTVRSVTMFNQDVNISATHSSLEVNVPYYKHGSIQKGAWQVDLFTSDATAAVTNTATKDAFNFDVTLVSVGGRLTAGGVSQTKSTATTSVSGVGNLALDANNRMFIGRVGEVIAFSRTLTDAERAAISAYLKKKWLNSSAAVEDIALTDSMPNSLTVEVPANARAAFAGKVESPIGVKVAKDGAGTLDVAAQVEPAGAVMVNEGTIALGAPIASRADVWLDATDANAVEFSTDGKVARVLNKGRSGGAFVQAKGWNNAGPVPLPGYAAEGINGRSALAFDGNSALVLNSYTNKNAGRSLFVYAALERTSWSSEGGKGNWGGPFSFNAVDATMANTANNDNHVTGSFHLEDTAATKVAHFLGNTSSVVDLGFNLNDTPHLFYSHQTSVGATFGFERASDAVNAVKQWAQATTNPIDIDVVMIGGRTGPKGTAEWTSNGNSANRMWYGLMGELIAFTRPLGYTEECALLAYLRKKWLNKGEGSATPPSFLSGDYGAPDLSTAGLVLEDGTGVSSSGPTLALASLTAGDGVAWTRDAAADPDGFAFFDVTGALALGANQTLNLVTAPSASAKLIGGAWSGELAPWTVTGDKASTTKVAARADGIWVGRATGAVIYLR